MIEAWIKAAEKHGMIHIKAYNFSTVTLALELLE